MRTVLLLLSTTMFLLTACKKTPAPIAVPQEPVTRPSGLVVQVLRGGDGDEAKKGDKITVHYVGTLRGGSKFDSSRDRDEPFAFWVGEGQVIAGWDEGIEGMREGEVRRLTVPPALGYGGDPKPGIPAGSTLLFDVELINVR